MSDGETAQEAVDNVQRAALDWVDAALAMGRDVPEPTGTEEYSGQWRIRMAKSLHRLLAVCAKREGVSLNLFAVSMLAKAIGARHPD